MDLPAKRRVKQSSVLSSFGAPFFCFIYCDEPLFNQLAKAKSKQGKEEVGQRERRVIVFLFFF